MRPGVTPVLIPNTKVKAWAADGTALETVWESRWLPDIVFLSSVKSKTQSEFRKQVVLSKRSKKELPLINTTLFE